MKGNLCGLLLLLVLCHAASGFAADMETYSQSVVNAKAHAGAPAGWVAADADMYKVSAAASGNASTYGLKYYGNPANNQVIVRTVSSSNAYNGYYGGGATTAGSHYTIYGGKTEMRAWVTTGKEMTGFIDGRGLTAATVVRGLEKGVGMDSTGTHDAIFEMAVTVGDGGNNPHLLRPTRNPDPTLYGTNAAGHGTAGVFPADAAAAGIGAGTAANAVLANYKTAYEAWANQAYSTNPFPWTQLGYTYHWGQAPNIPASLADIQGMSEFILLGGTGSADPTRTPSGTNESGKVVVVGIYSPQSYLYTKNDGTALSDAPDAQYGNGFASFNVTGGCDTLWAGAAFQVGTSLNAASPNTVTVGAGGSVSGGQGILLSSRNYWVTNAGRITANADTKKFNLAGSENIALLFKGDSHAGDVGAVKNILTNAGTIEAPGSAGTAVAAWAGNTEITNNAGGTITGGAYAIQTGAGDDTLTVNGGRIAGAVDLGAGTDTLNVTGAGATRFDLTLNRDTAAVPRVANVETVAIADNSTTLAVRIAAGTKNVRNNDQFLIVDAATALTVDPAKLTIVNDGNLPMVSFAAQKSGNRLSLLAARDGAYYGGRSGNASLGAVLDGLANSAAGDMATVIGALDGSGDPGDARKLAPAVNGGSVQAGFATAGQVSRAIVSRIGQVLAGRAAGDEAAREGIWGQGFGAFLRQDPRGGSDGYDANLWGGSFGYDRFVFPRLLLGFGGGYSHTAVRGENAGTWTNIQSYQANLYGSLARDVWYLDALLSYGHNRYEAARHIAFGGLDRTATGDYAGHQCSGYLEGGYGLPAGRAVITPLASLQVVRLRLNGYHEKGAGDANLSVEGQTYHFVQTGLGATLAWPIQEAEVRITPELHAKWLYDFAGDRQQTTSQFSGGGASFTTQGFEPARSSFIVGAMLTVMTKTNLTLSIGYDFEHKTDYAGHTGSLQIRYAF